MQLQLLGRTTILILVWNGYPQFTLEATENPLIYPSFFHHIYFSLTLCHFTFKNSQMTRWMGTRNFGPKPS